MANTCDILCVTAHPDDVELCSAGTVLKHVASGYKVGIVDMTAGELGTRGSAALRKEESERALKVLGGAFRYQLGMADGFFEETEENMMRVIRTVREHRPRVLITNALADRHPDHGRAGALVARAAFLSGLRKIDTSQDTWRPNIILHMIQDRRMEPDVLVDITPHYAKKMDAIKAFSSQFYDPESDEPESPISSKDFLDTIEARALEFGRLINTRYAEGFVSARPIGVEDLTRIL
jgi:bacillithiol biosynthesis deacetylase BshB1